MGSAPMVETSGWVATAQKPPPSRSTQHTGAVRRSSAYEREGVAAAVERGVDEAFGVDGHAWRPPQTIKPLGRGSPWASSSA